MTYQELLNQLQQLNPEQLNQDVAIWDEDNDEFYQQDVDLLFVDDTDVLDVDHPIIRFWWLKLHSQLMTFKTFSLWLIFTMIGMR